MYYDLDVFARVVRIAPEPIAVARRVAARYPDLALLHAGRGSQSWVAGGGQTISHALDPHELDPARADTDAWGAVPHWIGVIPYECRRDLERPGWSTEDRRPAPWMASPCWRRYPAVISVDRSRGEVVVVGDDRDAVTALYDAVAAPAPDELPKVCGELDETPAPSDHLTRVRRARQLILDGELYQVNLARRFGFGVRCATEEPPSRAMLALYERALTLGPTRFGTVLTLPEANVVSLSPELLLEMEARNGRPWRLRTEPIKGTRPRGTDAVADALLARELEADPKEQAELAMIIDVERNDLGSVCRPGTVRVTEPPRVVTHQTVHHREAVLVGAATETVTREEVLRAMVPSGSVTGAPKVRAMEVIAELEDHRRGLYTGGIGYIARDGSVRLSMAIRTLVVRGDRGLYWSGGGIVADSDPERELLETEWKATRLLTALAGG